MSARFIRRGVTQFRYSPTIANINAVTRAEWDAAEDITEHVADVSGWQLQNNSVPTPDMGSDFDSSIPGTNSVQDSSLTFYEDLEEEVIEAMFPQLTPGFVLIARKGDKPGSKSLDCHPTRVASKGHEISTGNDPARYVVTFNVTSKPGLDGPVPAAATP